MKPTLFVNGGGGGGSFRAAYNKVRNLKDDFPEVPLMALTATLPKSEEVSLAEDILRTPIILRSSASRSNICLKLQRYSPPKGKDATWTELAICIKEQVKEEKAIVYCSFTGECDDLCLALCDCGVEAAAYTGHNRTAAEKEQIHKNMNDGVIQVLVATQAFGLGVNIKWIRWVIHIGCPPNIPVWVQAAGRAGRDGLPANAVIYFAEHHDLQRVKFWTKNVAVDEKIKKKAQFKDVLLYLYTAMAGKCLQERQLAVFGEQHQSDETRETCCDGCEIKRNVCSVDVRKEIVQIQEALTELKTLGLSCVSETKLREWLNGKEMPWMGKYAPTDNQPEAASFGSLTKKPDVLGIILRQAAALDLVSLVILESRKDGRVDLINKYWSVTEENQQKLEEVAELILPTAEDINTRYEHKRRKEGKTQTKSPQTRNQVKQLLEDTETWETIHCKEQYQNLGFQGGLNSLLYTEDYTKVPGCPKKMKRENFIWNDVSMGKGSAHPVKTLNIKVQNKQLEVEIKRNRCAGVKVCSASGCNFAVGKLQKENKCLRHPDDPLITVDCEGSFVYVYPTGPNDRQRWLGFCCTK